MHMGPLGSLWPRATSPWSRRTAKHGIFLIITFLLFKQQAANNHNDDHSKPGLPLNDFVRHFEPAIYPPLKPVRIKRSSNDDDLSYPLSFNVTAHNRLFRIKVHNNIAQANNVFADDAVVESTHGPIDASGIRKRIYAGILEDLPDSSAVHGIVTKDGLFDGHISTPYEDYYIEPASRYFINQRPSFHSVIYKASDVVHPTAAEDGKPLPCKSHELHLRRREDMKTASQKSRQKSKNPRMSFNTVIQESFNLQQRRLKRQIQQEPLFENLSHWPQAPVADDIKEPKSAKQIVTTYEIVDWDDVPESIKYHFRKRSEARQALAEGRGVIDKKKKTCMLYLQADHLFYEAMGSEEACVEAMTRHVQRVNSIYEPIDFDQDGEPDNIRFMIKRIKVHTSKALEDPDYRFPGNYGVEKFLEIFSEENYDAFCLAYMFTYRDFEGGTLGLAWTGDMKNAGGVCERNGHYRGTLKSLNTGIITLLNYGKHVPPAVSHVTMAHEMGHNFGSPHDPENNKACVPGGEDGNYIMFARATSGDKSNNRKFSPCSLKSIKPVLLSKAIGPKGCFQEPKQALCGNGVVEEGEECDCGWEEDCEEDCCWPQRTEFPSDQKPCTLRPKRDCSPSQGPCCTDTCTFKLGEKCLDDNGCREESYCDGTSASCPLSQVRPNKTVCNKEYVCYKGECTGSICLAYGLESCQCSADDSPTRVCEICCKEPGDSKPCLSSFELNQAPFDVPDMFSKPGSPCNNYAGYCDVFRKCREVDPSGPLATLRKLLLSEESIASLKRFLMRYWYTVIFIALGVFLLMAIIIKICGKKTPLVRSRRKRRRQTIQHGADDPHAIDNPQAATEVQVHPTAVEAAVPLGKKVRKDHHRSASKGGGKKSSKGGRKVSKSRERSPPTSTTNTTPTNESQPTTVTNVEDGVARAVRLAANLSNQLFVDLPPEAASKSRGATAAGTSADPTTEASDDRKSRGKQKKLGKERKHKSLSPEKRLASTLAQSMSSISKSFEKLDLAAGQPRFRSRKRSSHATASGAVVSKNRSSRDPESSAKKARRRSRTAEKGPKEVTIAKLGRFKFSVEVAKHFDEELQGGTSSAAAASGSHKKADPERKISRKQEQEHTQQQANHRKESTTSAVTKLPSIHVTNFNSAKAGDEPPPSYNSVIVSKKRKERPRRDNSPDKNARKKSSKGGPPVAVGLDYRKSFNGAEKFTRSVSHPPPNNIESPTDESQCKGRKGQSFASGQRPSALKARSDQSRRLRRSETERLVQRPADQLWVAEFDNQGYDKSPEPLYQSISLNSLNKECSLSTSSTDSDLEVMKKTSSSAQISRAKILESVGVIVSSASSSAQTTKSSSSANLLLPPSSSSPSASSSVSLTGVVDSSVLPQGPSSEEAASPRLAFIGCETTSNQSSPSVSLPSSSSVTNGGGGGGVQAKRPSLSDRYPTTSSSSAIEDEDDNTEDNLDIISIITDGMN